jgi:ribosomal protein S18 acetylase RimI-like enzyme
VIIRIADLTDPADRAAFSAMMQAYAGDPMGGAQILEDQHFQQIAEALSLLPHAMSWIALVDNGPAGLLNGFLGYSTFIGAPLLNVHDLIVSSNVRRSGVAQALLENVAAWASSRGFCKLTLEVLTRNQPAKRLYEKVGFSPYGVGAEPGAEFWQKPLNQTH